MKTEVGGRKGRHKPAIQGRKPKKIPGNTDLVSYKSTPKTENKIHCIIRSLNDAENISNQL